MKVTLFRKQRTGKEGRKFDIFVSTLDKKDGTKQYVTVKYSGGDKSKEFDATKIPYIIIVDKSNANLQVKHWIDKNGQDREDFTLWIKDYTISSEKYIDHSLDDFI